MDNIELNNPRWPDQSAPYAYSTICKHCGHTYGEHRLDDNCPAYEANRCIGWRETKFEPIK